MRRPYISKVHWLVNKAGKDCVVIFSKAISVDLAEMKLRVSEGYLSAR
jgi:hypothetical protein